MEEVFGTDARGSNIHFDFEAEFEPFWPYSVGNLDCIDVVIREKRKQKLAFVRPLEIKLTVIPDQTTFNQKKKDWGPELVLRPASTSYMAMSIYHEIASLSDTASKMRAREIFEDYAANVGNWDNKYELHKKKEKLLDCLGTFLKEFHNHQKPFLLHPLWMTTGKSPELETKCFDVFIWSDFGLCRMLVEQSWSNKTDRISRFDRECARLVRFMNDLLTVGRSDVKRIYREMTFAIQTDKACSLPGEKTRQYMNHERRWEPILEKKILPEIILNGGENLLSPERRFDATIFFTCKNLFKSK